MKYMRGSSKGHLYSLDLMKFVAAIFITNSHFQPLYEGINTIFAFFSRLCIVLLCDWILVDNWIYND